MSVVFRELDDVTRREPYGEFVLNKRNKKRVGDKERLGHVMSKTNTERNFQEPYRARTGAFMPDDGGQIGNININAGTSFRPSYFLASRFSRAVDEIIIRSDVDSLNMSEQPNNGAEWFYEHSTMPWPSAPRNNFF